MTYLLLVSLLTLACLYLRWPVFTYLGDDDGSSKNEALLRNQPDGNLASKLHRNSIQIARSAKAKIRLVFVRPMF